MTIAQRSHEFFDAATEQLQVDDCRLFLEGSAPGAAPQWSMSWDRILLDETPGRPAIYAFAMGDGATEEDLQERVDRLAAGLTRSGLFSGPPISLVVVVVFDRSPDRALSNAASRLVPRLYISALRPRAVVVDLETGTIKSARTDPLRSVLTQVISQDAAPIARNARGKIGTHPVHAYYRLIQGRQPFVTYSLLALNVALFLLTLLMGGYHKAESILHGAPVSDMYLSRLGALQPTLVEQGQWWRFLSCMFLHASLMHIVFNMFSLLAVGTLAERLYGSKKFLAIYLGAGLVGGLLSFGHYALAGQSDVLAVGASGAIFGVAGALLTVRFQPSDVIPYALRVRITNSMLPLVGVSLVMAAATPYVDNSAHVGGVVGGIILSFAFPLTRRLPATL